MPITQDRMLALLEAADDYRNAWDRAQNYMNGLDEALASSRMTVEQAWSEARLLLKSTLQLNTPIKTTETLIKEITHFKAFKKRNIKAAQWQREKRDGVRAPRTKFTPKHNHGGHRQSQNQRLDSYIPDFGAAPELELEAPAGLSAETKARIEQGVADQLAADEYNEQYGSPAQPSPKPGVEQK